MFRVMGGRYLGAVIGLGALLSGPAAHALLIDDFSQSQTGDIFGTTVYATSSGLSNPKQASTSLGPGDAGYVGGILGGYRHLAQFGVALPSTGAKGTGEVSGGLLSMDNGTSVRSTLDVVWDGAKLGRSTKTDLTAGPDVLWGDTASFPGLISNADDNSATVDGDTDTGRLRDLVPGVVGGVTGLAYGLTGADADFTADGALGIMVGAFSFDSGVPPSSGQYFALTAYSGSAGADWSQANVFVPDTAFPQNYFVPFTSFVTMGGTGAAWTSISAFRLTLGVITDDSGTGLIGSTYTSVHGLTDDNDVWVDGDPSKGPRATDLNYPQFAMDVSIDFISTAVPEPSVALMLLGGLVPLWRKRRCR